VAYLFAATSFVIISAFLVLQMPPVQNWLASRFLKDFTKVVGFPTSAKGFRMLWFDRLELTGVNIYDLEGNRMIGAKQILINFKLLQLLDARDINIDGVFVDSAHVYLTNINDGDTARDLNINVFIDRINKGYAGGGGGGTGKAPRINIGEAFLNESQFTYNNQDADTVQYGFDYQHFSLAVDEGQLRSFVVLGDTTEFFVRTLIAQDLKSKFTVKQLSTFFRLSQTGMEFTGLDLQAGDSRISDTVIFRYNGHRELNDFVDKVKIHATLRNTIIHPKDLDLFAPGVHRVKQPLNLSGVFNGRVSNFKFTKMSIGLGNTELYGSLDMEGLPNFNETFINLNVKNSRLDPEDIAFVFNDATLQRIKPLGILAMHGQFLGYPNDFVANGSFVSKLGSIKSDINFKINEKNIDYSIYKGRLALTGFDMGRYLNDTTQFQKVTLDGKISGMGLTQSTADFLLNGRITSIGIRGYNYTNIRTDARFATGLFRGLVQINDPNLEMLARGSIDLRDNRNEIKILAQLDTAYLHRLKLARDSIFLHANVDANIQGLTLDSLRGTANVNDLHVIYKNQNMKLDHVQLDAQRQGGQRQFKVSSTLLDVDASGSYNFSDISLDIQTLIREIILNLGNDKVKIAEYYRQKTLKPKSYEARIAVNLKNIKPITSLLGLDMKLSPNTRFDGRFTSGRTTIFNIYSEFDSLQYEGKTFLKSNIELTVSKISDSTSVLSMITVNSEKQILNPNLSTRNLLAEAIWNRNHIDFSLDADHDGQTNYARLKGGINFLRDSTVIVMNPSQLQLLERKWSFAPDNYVALNGTDWTFHNLALVNLDQSIQLDGKISSDPSKTVSLNIDNLNMSIFNVLTAQKFAGVADAEFDISNYYKKPLIQNSINITDLTINDFLIGNLTGENRWDTLENKLNINLFVERMSNRIIHLAGDYSPTRKDNPLNLTAMLDKANLKIAEPFLIDIFSNIGGTVSGKFGITGELDNPQIRGEGKVADGQIMINYLKTLYRFTGTIGLTPNSIYFKHIELQDNLRNKATLQGEITHVGFNSMAIEMRADFANFQVLNTSSRDNSLFYGQAYASGDVTFRGPLSNMNIASTARTEKNTHVYIPLSGSASVDKKEFISLVNFNDTTLTKKIEKDLQNKINLTGLTFDLNLDVTPDAYCEIIFDLKAGDIIQGRGNGDLRLQIDTKGDFTMFGPFQFTEGKYNFTMYNIINKDFVIDKGSRITWYGDPYRARVDINATYNQMASFAPLVLAIDPLIKVNQAPQLQRRYPVKVLVKLEGAMLAPDISFDITARDLPKSVPIPDHPAVNLDFQFTAFKNKLDEQELNRQVFSLIVLRKFSPPESLSTSGSVVSSLSELFSNQLSNWMSHVDEDLTIDLDLGSMDEESFNTFQLRLSYTFLNGRLRVTGDGTYNNSTTVVTANGTQQNPSSLAGDWTVDYSLTPDGKLRVKMYSRTSVNPILSSVNNQNTITTGASLIHTQSFDRIRDLWTSSRKKRQSQQQQEDDPEFNTDAIKEEDGTD
jgi:hypothetical protein